VRLYYETVMPETLSTVQNWKASDGLQESKSQSGSGTLEFTGYASSGDPEFYYVKVQQEDDDRAWTAPVWINHPKPDGADDKAFDSPSGFVWSKKSRTKVYHVAGCKWAARIWAENRASGTEPPGDWRKHNCELLSDDEHNDDHDH